MSLNIAAELERKLTGSEWRLVEDYILRADSFERDGRDAEARRALEDAVAVALANNEPTVAQKIQYYLRFL